MERPDITEERFDEILIHASRINSMIETFCYDFEQNEIFIIMSLILARKSEDTSSGNREESEKNLRYIEQCIMKKANSSLSKDK